jgi:alpha-mannosidase
MPRKAHYVLSTHWDREWYQTFQDYRYRLVNLLDRVLEGWEREDLCGPFQTDGQAVMLEDYLEVRPERAEQIRQLVKSGRFVVGPWYVLPDEFLVSGESLVRNIRLGRQVAREFGGQPSDAGFLCDMFGHNSQMPQILRGFGIRAGFLWRGTNNFDQALFRWRGADGTELPCYRFGKIGYCSYAIQVRSAHTSDPRPGDDEIEQRLQEYLAEEAGRTAAGPLLLFDGGDHLQWDAEAYRVLSQHLGSSESDYEIIHSTLEAYMDELEGVRDQIVPVIEGELREPGLHRGGVDEQWLIPGVTSSRVLLKQANADCQDMLCQWAEPVSALATAALGLAYPQGYLDVAWRWLIQNHPHDSICGCSIDSVHDDMFYRFHQCEQIASRLTTEAALAITASVALDEDPSGEVVRAAVFNPLARPFEGIADLELEIPSDWPAFYEMMGTFERKPGFRIFDAAGNEIPYQRTGQAMDRARVRTRAVTFPQGYSVHMVKVSLALSIPATGYTTLTLRPAKAGEPVRLAAREGLVKSERSMENEYLRVEFEPNGTLSLTDKRTGQVYQRLLTFEDQADIGDGWNFCPAVNGQTDYSTGSRTSLALVCDGPYRATFRVRAVMDVPAAFRFDDMVRSEELCQMRIDSLVTLRAGADRVEVETTVHNQAQDHRLRVLFPSGTSAETCLMDSPFDVVERKIALREDNYLYRELEVETKPQQSFTAVYDEDPARGLAVLSTGLLECAVQDLPERPLALTLFRATRRTVMTNGEPGGQMQGELKFRCWIAPLAGNPDRARLFDLAQALSGGLRAVHVPPVDLSYYRAGKQAPVSAGLLSVEGPAVLTSLRRVGDALEARLFNPNIYPVDAAVRLGDLEGLRGVIQAQPVNLESTPVGDPIPVENGVVSLRFGPKQVRTIRL